MGVCLAPPAGCCFGARLFSNIMCRKNAGGTGGADMKSAVVKRSIAIAGRKTSVSLEDAFWNALKEIASHRKLTLSEVVDAVDSGREHSNLSSALRLFVLDHYRAMIASDMSTRSSAVQMVAPVI